MRKKAYISRKLKKYTDRLFCNKCFFCDKSLVNASKGERHYHHFVKESDGASTVGDVLVLSCVVCHRKVHHSLNISAEMLLKIILTEIKTILRIKDLELPSVSHDISKIILKVEYSYFRDLMYFECCAFLGIIPCRGDMYHYDDDMMLHPEKDLPENFYVVRRFLQALDINLAKMSRQEPRSRRYLKMSRRKRHQFIRYLVEIIEALAVDNNSRKFSYEISSMLDKIRERSFSRNEYDNLLKFALVNNSQKARVFLAQIRQYDKIMKKPLSKFK